MVWARSLYARSRAHVEREPTFRALSGAPVREILIKILIIKTVTRGRALDGGGGLGGQPSDQLAINKHNCPPTALRTPWLHAGSRSV